MRNRDSKSYKTLIINTSYKIFKFNKCRKDFFREAIMLFLSIKELINFLKLGRFGNFNERRYRQQFEKLFPFLDFNKKPTLFHGGKRFVIVFDPSYTRKSGKKMPGLSWSWSGSAGQAKWDLETDGPAAIDLEILDCYRSRFHIEFLHRDGKHNTVLTDSQARSKYKLNFHFNAGLAAINIAKVEHWLSLPKEKHKSFSIADIKTMNHNRLLLKRFIDLFGVNAYYAKNHNLVNELIYYGAIAT